MTTNQQVKQESQLELYFRHASRLAKELRLAAVLMRNVENPSSTMRVAIVDAEQAIYEWDNRR